jgi:hypothetical protein
MRWGLATVALLAIAAAPRDTRAEDAKTQAALAKELAGLTAGPAQACISTFETRDSSVTSFGDTLVYRTAGRTRYVSHTSGCSGVGGDNILITRSPSTQLCSGDIATTVDRTSRIQSGSCSLGEFTPYRP